MDLLAGENKREGILAINPTSMIPAILHRDGPSAAVTVIESIAILIIVTVRTGRLPPRPVKHVRGPRVAQVPDVHGSSNARPDVSISDRPGSSPFGVPRFTHEAARIPLVRAYQLEEVEFLGEDDFVADIATYPWGVNCLPRGQEYTCELSSLGRMLEAFGLRTVLQRGQLAP